MFYYSLYAGKLFTILLGEITTDRRGYDVPFCSDCARHRLRRSRAISILAFATVLGAFLYPILWRSLRLGRLEWTSGYILLGVLAFILVPYLVYRGLWPTLVLLSPKMQRLYGIKDCCLIKEPVGFHESHFKFRDEAYALEFAGLNGLQALALSWQTCVNCRQELPFDLISRHSHERAPQKRGQHRSCPWCGKETWL